MRPSWIFYLFGGLVVAQWLWRTFGSPRPAFEPLRIDADDPLMVAAIAQARGALDEFRALFAAPHNGARLKVPFVTSEGVRELLWSEVQRLGDAEAEVLYLTPPVTHTGSVERVQVYPLEEIVDWQIELADGTYRGGFTMRVMFIRHREQFGDLPPELAAEERKYAHEV